ncbi:MAG: PD40 domain-containing protein [Verrucomicrobiales bacterium]|nr:PD40 domain-containing protein [Verrucomicrobiales bacterium]
MKIELKWVLAALLAMSGAGTLGQTLPDNVVRVGNREYLVGEPAAVPVWAAPFDQDLYITISSDGRTLMFDSSRPGSLGEEDFWMSTRESLTSAWSEPTHLGSPINTIHDEYHGRLSPDGLSFYFKSNRPGGHGDFDLWVATRTSSATPFGAPTNLGPNINGPENDGPATVSGDGLTMVFASYRPGKLGQAYGFWISTRPQPTAEWGTPTLLDEPIGSTFFDVVPCLSADGLMLFFGSNREDDGFVNAWVAVRPDRFAAFGEPALLRSLVDPEGLRSREPVGLSADGTILYYIYFRDLDRNAGILNQVSLTRLPRLGGPSVKGEGRVEFDLFGRDGVDYAVETSSDLRTWNSWITTNTTQSVRLVDSIPQGQAPRYYRALIP